MTSSVTCARCGAIVCQVQDLGKVRNDEQWRWPVFKPELMWSTLTRHTFALGSRYEKAKPVYPLKCKGCSRKIATFSLFDPPTTQLRIPSKRKKKPPVLLGLPTKHDILPEIFAESLRPSGEFCNTQHWPAEDTNFLEDMELDPEDVPNLLQEKVPHKYQIELFFRALEEKRTILILPTGCGKTAIGMMVLQWMADANPLKLGAILSPTIPLVHQHYVRMSRDTSLSVEYLFGARRDEEMTAAMVRKEWQVISFTAGLFAELLAKRVINIRDFHTLVLDEAHCVVNVTKQRGYHPSSDYEKVIKYYRQCPESQRPLLLSLSASPGACATDLATMQLFGQLETKLLSKIVMPNNPQSLRALEDFHRTVHVHRKAVPEDPLADLVIKTLQSYVAGQLTEKSRDNNRSQLHSLVSMEFNGDYDIRWRLKNMLKLCDSLELLGTPALQLAGALSDLPLDDNLRQRVLSSPSSERVDGLCELIKVTLESVSSEDFRGIIFVKRRETAHHLARLLADSPDRSISELKPRSFVGHGRHHDGMDAQEQQDCMEDFQRGQHRLLVATSVLEEGIDVPQCNFAVALEGSNSFRSFVQCRGRVRMNQGRFYVYTSNPSKIEQMEQQEITMQRALRQYTASSSVLNPPSWGLMEQVLVSQSYSYLTQVHESPNLSFRSERFHLLWSSPVGKEIDKALLRTELSRFGQIHFASESDQALVVQPKRKRKAGTIEDILSCSQVFQPGIAFQVILGHFALLNHLHANNSSRIRGSWTGSLSMGDMAVGMSYEPSVPPTPGVGWQWQIHEFGMEWTYHEDEVTEMQYKCAFDSIRGVVIDWVTSERELRAYILLRHPPKFLRYDQRCHMDDTGLTLCFTSPVNSADGTFSAILGHLEFRDYHVWFARIHLIDHLGVAAPQGDYVEEGLVSNYRASVRDLFQDSLPEWAAGQPLSALKLVEQYLMNTLFPHPQSFAQHLLLYAPIDQIPPPTEHVALVRSIVITPSRVYYKDPSPIPTNTVIRHYDPNDFLIVSFRDEDLQSYPTGPAMDRLEYFCRHGLVVAGHHFSFLAGSNSQLRNQSCYLYRGDAAAIRGVLTWIGDKPLRAGLAFSASRDIPVPGLDAQEDLADIVRGRWTFTDGTGEASRDVLTLAAQQMKVSSAISAIQIRYAGSKGVLLLSPPGRHVPETSIRLRPSMHKFSTERRTLSVLSVSGPSPGFLNGQLITLLAARGVATDVFFRLQVEHLHQFQMQHAQVGTWTALSHFFPPVRDMALREGLVGPLGSFCQQLQLASFRSALQDPLRILIPKARMALIVPDPVDRLEEGQVYFTASHLQGGPRESHVQTIEGRVLLVKFPAHHPGDVLTLMAVDVPEWRSHYRDIIIVSTRGERPIADQSSGGDYDGDRFLICWDEDLIPSSPYSPAPSDVLEKQNTPSEKSLIDHFVSVARQSTLLGRWSNYHLAASNLMEEGPMDHRCLELDQKLRQLVDFPKTGLLPTLDEEFYRDLGVPGFMQQSHKRVVSCSTVCQLLFDRAERLMAGLDALSNDFITPREMPACPKISKIYQHYVARLRSIMRIYDISSEADLYAGCFSKERWRGWSAHIALVNEHLMVLWRDMQEECEQYLNDQNGEEQQQSIEDWLNFPFTQGGNNRFLSFSCFVPLERLRLVPPEESLSGSLCQNWRNTVASRQMAYRLGIECTEQLQEQLDRLPGSYRAHLFGSRSQWLATTESDYDITITHANGQGLSEAEFDTLLAAFRSVYVEVEDLGVGRRYRLSGLQCMDVVHSVDGLRKRDLVHAYVLQQPLLLVALNVLLYWGRQVGLGSIVGNRSSWGLVYCAIEYGLRSNRLQVIDPTQAGPMEEKELYEIFSRIETALQDPEQCAWLSEFILRFLEENQLHPPPTTPDPITGKELLSIASENAKLWTEIGFQAAISLHMYQDVSVLLHLRPPKEAVTRHWEFYSVVPPEEREFESVAPHTDIRLESHPEHRRRWRLIAKGLPKHLRPLEDYMRRRCTVRGTANSVFVEGSTHLKWLGYDPENDQLLDVNFLTVKDSGDKIRMRLSEAVREKTDANHNRLIAQFKRCYLQQLNSYQTLERDHGALDIKLRFGGFAFRNPDALGPRWNVLPFSYGRIMDSMQQGYKHIALRRLKRWRKTQKKRTIHRPRVSKSLEDRPVSRPAQPVRTPQQVERRSQPIRYHRDMSISTEMVGLVKQTLAARNWNVVRKCLQVHVHYPMRDGLQERQLIYRKPFDAEDFDINAFEADLSSDLEIKRTTGARITWLAYGVIAQDSSMGFRMQMEAHQANDRADGFLMDLPPIRIARGKVIYSRQSNHPSKVRLRVKEDWASPCGRMKGDVSRVFVWEKKGRWKDPREEWTSHLAPKSDQFVGTDLFQLALDILSAHPQ